MTMFLSSYLTDFNVHLITNMIPQNLCLTATKQPDKVWSPWRICTYKVWTVCYVLLKSAVKSFIDNRDAWVVCWTHPYYSSSFRRRDPINAKCVIGLLFELRIIPVSLSVRPRPRSLNVLSIFVNSCIVYKSLFQKEVIALIKHWS